MTEFGGWLMPLSYPSGTVAEHLACRRDAAIFDVSHLGSVRVVGEDALDRLQRAFTNDLTKIAPGRAQYTHLLDESGSVLDDIIVWWVADDDFLVIPNASNTERVILSTGGQDITSDRALLAVQGPRSKERLVQCWGEAVWAPRFQVREIEIESISCLVAGTGYTGEDGIEIHVPREEASKIWTALVETGITPAGLGARDTLRLEAGLPLHGNEFRPGVTPLQAGFDWVVGWSKESFNGKHALEVERRNGIRKRLCGIATQGRRPPRSDSPVLSQGRQVGIVTSGNYSPVLEHGIALALVDPDIGVGDDVIVQQRGVELKGAVVETPFVSRSQA